MKAKQLQIETESTWQSLFETGWQSYVQECDDSDGKIITVQSPDPISGTVTAWGTFQHEWIKTEIIREITVEEWIVRNPGLAPDPTAPFKYLARQIQRTP